MAATERLRLQRAEATTPPPLVEKAFGVAGLALAITSFQLLLAVVCTISFVASGGPQTGERASAPLGIGRGTTAAAAPCEPALSTQPKECHHVRIQD